MAIVQLRGRLGLTQTELAARAGTTQSVIARLESGRQPVEIKLLNRIADACETAWGPVFVGPRESEEPVGSSDALAAGSGDLLLDAFNAANTSGRRKKAHKFAQQLLADPSSPRRRLAIGLDYFNETDYAEAITWATDALGEGLPSRSQDVAHLVLARSYLAQDHPLVALRHLTAVGRDNLGWIVEAARAEAYLQAGRGRAATKSAKLALQQAGDERTAAYYLMARVDWHFDRPWDALDNIRKFRTSEGTDSDGILLHGSILAFLGDRTGEKDLWERALALFKQAVPSGKCEALRLCAMVSTRLGDWKGSISWSRRLLAHIHQSPPGAGPRPHHSAAVDHILEDLFASLGADADLVQEAVRLSESLPGIDQSFLASQRSFGLALGGDYEGAMAAIDRTEDTLSGASAEDQIRVTVALATRGDYDRAYPILVRNEAELSDTDGLLMLARSALATGHRDVARRVLKRVAKGRGATAVTAQIALDLAIAVEQAGAERFLAAAMGGRAKGRLNLLIPSRVADRATVDTTWEGTHGPTSAVIDRVAAAAQVN
jgi:transcriptional regulator with XRE-family HTH domain